MGVDESRTRRSVGLSGSVRETPTLRTPLKQGLPTYWKSARGRRRRVVHPGRHRASRRGGICRKRRRRGLALRRRHHAGCAGGAVAALRGVRHPRHLRRLRRLKHEGVRPDAAPRAIENAGVTGSNPMLTPNWRLRQARPRLASVRSLAAAGPAGRARRGSTRPRGSCLGARHPNPRE